MARLTDTQLVVLSAAGQRDGGCVLPLPDRLKSGAASKVVQGLLDRGLAVARPAERDEPVWRETEEGRVTLAATPAAFEALGIEPDSAPEGAAEGAPAARASRGEEPAPAAARARTPRQGTKQALLISMLEGDGATIAEITQATGWQPHTVRGAIAGALKKRLGLDVTSEKLGTRGRVYRIAG